MYNIMVHHCRFYHVFLCQLMRIHFSLLAAHETDERTAHTQNYFVFSSTRCQGSSHTLTRTHKQKQILSLVKSFIGKGESLFALLHVGRVAGTFRSDIWWARSASGAPFLSIISKREKVIKHKRDDKIVCAGVVDSGHSIWYIIWAHNFWSKKVSMSKYTNR